MGPNLRNARGSDELPRGRAAHDDGNRPNSDTIRAHPDSAMTDNLKLDRRDFLKQAAGVMGAAMHTDPWTAASAPPDTTADQPRHQPTADVSYPRRFTGRQLRMISFPLGGVAAGSLGLGGRGQLIDWEIFNRPNKGFRPSYAFPAIWAQAGRRSRWRACSSRASCPPMKARTASAPTTFPGFSRLESATLHRRVSAGAHRF